jgi:hypothetical protein
VIRLRSRRRARVDQRKADESLAAAALGYRRARLGIDVAPRACPVDHARTREEGPPR